MCESTSRWCVLCEYHVSANEAPGWNHEFAAIREKPAISREFSCAKLQPRLISRLHVTWESRLSSFKTISYMSGDGNELPRPGRWVAAYTRHMLKEGSIDVSNWESFVHCVSSVRKSRERCINKGTNWYRDKIVMLCIESRVATITSGILMSLRLLKHRSTRNCCYVRVH